MEILRVWEHAGDACWDSGVAVCKKWGVRLVLPGRHANCVWVLYSTVTGSGMTSTHLCTGIGALCSTVVDSDFLSAFSRSTTLRGYKLFKRPSTDNDR